MGGSVQAGLPLHRRSTFRRGTGLFPRLQFCVLSLFGSTLLQGALIFSFKAISIGSEKTLEIGKLFRDESFISYAVYDDAINSVTNFPARDPLAQTISALSLSTLTPSLPPCSPLPLCKPVSLCSPLRMQTMPHTNQNKKLASQRATSKMAKAQQQEKRAQNRTKAQQTRAQEAQWMKDDNFLDGEIEKVKEGALGAVEVRERDFRRPHGDGRAV